MVMEGVSLGPCAGGWNSGTIGRRSYQATKARQAKQARVATGAPSFLPAFLVSFGSRRKSLAKRQRHGFTLNFRLSPPRCALSLVLRLVFAR